MKTEIKVELSPCLSPTILGTLFIKQFNMIGLYYIEKVGGGRENSINISISPSPTEDRGQINASC